MRIKALIVPLQDEAVVGVTDVLADSAHGSDGAQDDVFVGWVDRAGEGRVELGI